MEMRRLVAEKIKWKETRVQVSRERRPCAGRSAWMTQQQPLSFRSEISSAADMCRVIASSKTPTLFSLFPTIIWLKSCVCVWLCVTGGGGGRVGGGLTPGCWVERKPPYRGSPGPAASCLMFAYQPDVVLQNKGPINVSSRVRRKVETTWGGGGPEGGRKSPLKCKAAFTAPGRRAEPKGWIW